MSMRFGLREKLLGGFGMVLLLFIITVIVSLNSIWLLKENVELTHDHPLAVSKAVIRIEVLTTSMHSSLKDAVLSTNKNERANYLLTANRKEKEALKQFDIVLDRILDNEGLKMAKDAKKHFLRWRIIRNRVIQLINSSKFELAQIITQNEGNYYVKTITYKLKGLEDYAANKARRFNMDSGRIAKKTRTITIITYTISVLISLLIFFVTLKYLTKRLRLIQKAASELSKNGGSEPLDKWNPKQIDRFIESFKKMTIRVKESHNSLEQNVHERTSELQSANEQLILLKESLESKVEERTKELEAQVNKLDKSQKAMLYLVEDLNETSDKLKGEQKKLNMANKELEAFTYSVSHDLRAPLRAIEGFSKFLVKDYTDKLDDEGKRFIRVIRENTKKMDQLITDLLNLSRVTKSEMKFTTINMKHLAETTFDEITTEEEKQVFEIKIDNLPDTQGDVTLIKQVWSNLIGNSLKYSSKSKKKKIEIGTLKEENLCTYFVKDYGAGFNSKYTNKLFGIFQRLHKDSEFKGTGVGLAIVKRILDKHNGKIWAEGEVNEGATFYFSLPA